MDLNQWRELASDYIEDALPADRKAEIQHFLSENPEARREEEQLRAILQNLQAPTTEVDPPLFFADNIMSRLQREQEEKAMSGWQRWLPGIGRLAIGSLATGGVLAALAWNFLFPHQQNVGTAGLSTGTIKVAPDPAAPRPQLKVGAPHVQTGTEIALELPLHLENAKTGFVVASVPGGKETGFFLSGNQDKTLRVPVGDEEVVTVRVGWTGEGTQGEQWIAAPQVKKQQTSDRMSFGLGELALPQAITELSRIYNRTILLEDARKDLKINFDARNETLPEMLQRQLTPLGFTVTTSEQGVVTLSAKR